MASFLLFFGCMTRLLHVRVLGLGLGLGLKPSFKLPVVIDTHFCEGSG